MKPINIPLFSYHGNKDNEMDIIKENLPDMTNIDTIIEPYCGSFALIRYLLTIYPNKEYICVDNDKLLIETYQTLQDDTLCNELLEFYKSLKINNKTDYDAFKKTNSVKSYLYTHVIYSLVSGLFNKNKHCFNERDFNRLIHFNKTYKNIKFLFSDASEIIDQYKNNSRCFIFLDPPFLLTSSFYSCTKSNNLDIFFKLLMDINKLDSKLLCVCGDNFLLIPFYEKYNIKIKFLSTLFYRGNKTKEHKNYYVSNY